MKKRFFSFIFVLMFVLFGFAGAAAAPLNAQNLETRYAATIDIAPRGGIYVGVFNERIDYDYKVVDYFALNPKLPAYSSSYTCGIVAGGVIVCWYNKQYPQLIPGHTAGTTFLGTWLWATANSYTAGVNAQLNTDMNANAQGVTINGYLNGLNTYVTGKGKNFTSQNIMGSGGELLNSNYKAALQNGKLLTVFVDGFNVLEDVNINEDNEGYDIITLGEYTGAHIMAAYGYYEITYYNADGSLIQKDIYLYVHTGLGGSLGMIKLTSHCTLDNAFITHIN